MKPPDLRMVDVVGQYSRIREEVDAAINKVLSSGKYILGEEVSTFESAMAKYLPVSHTIGCASGTDALQVALMALGIGPGDEVITTPFSFVATTETIVLLGAKPVYVDIEADSFNIDPLKIEGAITEKTRAIIPVHLYGQPARMDRIMQIAGEHKIPVIEDAAQAIGASFRDQKVCTFGDLGCLSFFPSKNLGSFGDAGMVVTNNENLAVKVRAIIQHGSNRQYHHDMLGINSRLDTIQAAILEVKLKYLDEWNKSRRGFAATYDELLSGLPVGIPKHSRDCYHIFHQYTMRVPDRDRLSDHLRELKIPHGVYYPIPLHLQKAFSVAGGSVGSFPVSEKAATEVISLPMHTELTEEQMKYITGSIRTFYS